MSTSQIPIQNVYYLLAYAWKHYRRGEERNISAVDCPDSLNLLAHLLAQAVPGAVKRGVDREYVVKTETTASLRGRFDLVGSYRTLTHLSGKLICEFDELTSDTLPNQIVKSTCLRLLRSSQPLTRINKSGIRLAADLFEGVSKISISDRTFRKVQLHHNNRHYRLLMNICELLHHCHTPDAKSGRDRFSNFLDDDRLMATIFEEFVREFAAQHVVGAKVKAMHINWRGIWDDEISEVIPKMITDVTIDHPEHKTILDCKFYRKALVTREDRKRLHSSHLYQLTAYLQNKSRDDGWEHVRGVLLYPAVNHHLNLKFELLGFPVEIQSVDLDQPWRSIHDQLFKLVCGSVRETTPPKFD